MLRQYIFIFYYMSVTATCMPTISYIIPPHSSYSKQLFDQNYREHGRYRYLPAEQHHFTSSADTKLTSTDVDIVDSNCGDAFGNGFVFIPATSTVSRNFFVLRISIKHQDRRPLLAIPGLFGKRLRLTAHSCRIRSISRFGHDPLECLQIKKRHHIQNLDRPCHHRLARKEVACSEQLTSHIIKF